MCSCFVLRSCAPKSLIVFFFFNDTATTEIYTLSLHDALPISKTLLCRNVFGNDLIQPQWSTLVFLYPEAKVSQQDTRTDRKSTRLNSSHTVISYAVFCLKKKKVAAAWSIKTGVRTLFEP